MQGANTDPRSAGVLYEVFQSTSDLEKCSLKIDYKNKTVEHITAICHHHMESQLRGNKQLFYRHLHNVATEQHQNIITGAVHLKQLLLIHFFTEMALHYKCFCITINKHGPLIINVNFLLK